MTADPEYLRTLAAFPLDAAYLCLDCKCVGNRSTACVACASTHLLCLAAVLNRPEIEVEGKSA